MTGSGKGSGILIAGNIKSSVLYDAQKLRRLQLGLAQDPRIERRKRGAVRLGRSGLDSRAGGGDPARVVRIQRRR